MQRMHAPCCVEINEKEKFDNTPMQVPDSVFFLQQQVSNGNPLLSLKLQWAAEVITVVFGGTESRVTPQRW